MPGALSLRIGTRGSRLALAQARIAADLLCSCHQGLNVEIVPLATRGDRHRGALAPVGGKGLFTAELEAALREGRLDLAVHSAKDLPAAMADDLVIAAVPPRADVRDVLLSRDGTTVADLPAGAWVGTGSLRRRAQLLDLRGDLEITPLRGNVETRVSKVLSDESPLAAVMTTLPPCPPSPPFGPPRGTYFSRRKLTQPFPPLPPRTEMVAVSISIGRLPRHRPGRPDPSTRGSDGPSVSCRDS